MANDKYGGYGDFSTGTSYIQPVWMNTAHESTTTVVAVQAEPDIIINPAPVVPNIPPVNNNDDNRLMIVSWNVHDDDGRIRARVCTRASYFQLRDQQSHILNNAVVDDLTTGRRIYFDDQAQVLDEIHLEDEPQEYNIESSLDFVTAEPLIHLIQATNIYTTQEEEIKPEGKIMLTADMIALIRKNPRGYFDKHIKMQKGPEPDRLTRINRLLHVLLFEEGQFDEEFTIIEAKPKSFKLKTYIDNLAELVSKELDANDEIGNLDELRKQAYKTVDFKQTLEQVMEAAEEYNDYFKYKMIKDEKVIITRAEYEDVQKSIEAIKASEYYKLRLTAVGYNKMLPRKELFVEKLGPNQSFGIACTPDEIKRTSDYKTIDAVKVVKIPRPLSEFPHLIATLGLDLEAAVINRCASAYFKKDLSSKWKLNIHFLVVDDNNNVYAFVVKAGTIAKWNKKLNEELDKVAYHIDNNTYHLPWEFHNISMSI